jgi:hypothetical protein
MTTTTGGEMTEYKCTCGASGVKLWRRYQSFDAELFCVDCAGKTTGKDVSAIDSASLLTSDQIGNLVPAVPSPSGFWGYNSTSMPAEAVAWWQNMPLRASSWEVWTIGPDCAERYVGIVEATSEEEAGKLADERYGHSCPGGLELRPRQADPVNSEGSDPGPIADGFRLVKLEPGLQVLVDDD